MKFIQRYRYKLMTKIHAKNLKIMTSKKVMMRWKFLLRPQFLEDVKKKLLNYISPRIGTSTYYQFSPLTIACYIYIFISVEISDRKKLRKGRI